MERTFDTLLASYPPDVQTLALCARELVLELLPSADESVDGSGPYVGYGYGSGYKNTICTLIMSKTGVKLGVVGGAALPDPKRLLRGSGKVHRHVPLKSPSDLRKPGLRTLVRAAEAAWRRRTSARAGVP